MGGQPQKCHHTKHKQQQNSGRRGREQPTWGLPPSCATHPAPGLSSPSVLIHQGDEQWFPKAIWGEGQVKDPQDMGQAYHFQGTDR